MTTELPRQRTEGLEPVRRPGAPARVLVVDDNDVNRILLQRQLEKLGVHASSVAGGADAVAAHEAEPYDLILLDFRMPGMDGPEVARRIRAEEADDSSRVPIVSVTADRAPDTRRRALEAGMDDLVEKPLSMALLAEILRQWGVEAASLPGLPVARFS